MSYLKIGSRVRVIKDSRYGKPSYIIGRLGVILSMTPHPDNRYRVGLDYVGTPVVLCDSDLEVIDDEMEVV